MSPKSYGREGRLPVALAALFVMFLTQTVHGQTEAAVQITSVSKAVTKLDCVTLSINGYVTNVDGIGRIPGVTITASYLNDDGVGDIYYYDHVSYLPGPLFPFNPSLNLESHAISDAQGNYYLRIDVCPNSVQWDAAFLVCATKEGYQDQCLSASFDQGTSDAIRIFNPPVVAGPTATPTPSATATATPSSTSAPTASPTPTTSAPPRPTAVHPELDLDGDQIIGPGDLILFLQDWMRPIH
jgi:hypothetical protein